MYFRQEGVNLPPSQDVNKMYMSYHIDVATFDCISTWRGHAFDASFIFNQTMLTLLVLKCFTPSTMLIFLP